MLESKYLKILEGALTLWKNHYIHTKLHLFVINTSSFYLQIHLMFGDL